MKSRTLYAPNMGVDKLKFPLIASVKYDGRNTRVYVRKESITYFTSGGKDFTLVNNEPFDQLPEGVYECEMMGDGIAGQLGDRVHSGIQTTMFTNTRKGIANHHRPTWKIFYYNSHEDWVRGSSPVTYETMIDKLYGWLDAIDCLENMIWTAKIHDYEMLLRYYDKKIKQKWEGLMLAQPDLKWKDSTSRLITFVKMKAVPTLKATIQSVKEGTGKYEGMIGSFDCITEDGYSFNVGSGLTDADREIAPYDYIGLTIRVKYEQLIDGVPQQPRFDEVV